MTDAHRLVNKLWPYGSALGDDGDGGVDPIEQLTHPSFPAQPRERSTRRLEPQRGGGDAS